MAPDISKHDPWKQRIQAAGLRVTRPRYLVYRLLGESGGHRSADEALALLTERNVVISRASVYNVISDLVEAGLLMVADAGPGRALYEAAEQWHHHFVCRKCHRIFDVPCAVGARPCLEANLPGAEIDEAQIIFRGLCPGCKSPDGAMAYPNRAE